jgi:2,3-bisphosphoglycerate-dependent phosphoglycerate mutase
VPQEIFFIRHGLPIQNSGVPYQIPPGPDLSERGRIEARQAATFLAGRGVEQLFVSPFARTTQTAEVMIDILNLQATFTALVQEQAPHETLDAVRVRMRELFAGLADSPYKRVGIVTHGSPIRAGLLELSSDKIDLSNHVYPGGNPAPTCGIWHVQLVDEQTQRFELVFKPSEG